MNLKTNLDYLCNPSGVNLKNTFSYAFEKIFIQKRERKVLMFPWDNSYYMHTNMNKDKKDIHINSFLTY